MTTSVRRGGDSKRLRYKQDKDAVKDIFAWHDKSLLLLLCFAEKETLPARRLDGCQQLL